MSSVVDIADGTSWAPQGEHRPVVKPDEFKFAAAFLDHGHIYGQVRGLLEAGATLTAVYDPDPGRAGQFADVFPQARVCRDFDELLADKELALIAAAAIPDERAAVGRRVIEAGKDYFTDKSPFTTLQQLEEIRLLVAETGRKYLVYYAERIHNEAAWHAGELIGQGAIGEVVQVLNLAPHRLSADKRPDWFFQKPRYGGIITDIGSHQIEQFLTYSGCRTATVNFARAENCCHPEYPGLEDFGEFSMTGDSITGGRSVSFYSRVDWFTPDGMPVWGDGRTFILGSEGSLEIRKYTDLGREAAASMILLADDREVHRIDCLGKVGFPFFGQMVLDVLNRTENAMKQEHAFKAAELSIQAQTLADLDKAGG